MISFSGSRMVWSHAVLRAALVTARVAASVAALVAALVAVSLGAAPAHAQGGTVYRCPGNPILYTDALGAKEARDKGCRTLEGAPISVIAAPRRVSGPSAGAVAAPASRPAADSKIDPNEQKARDTDARRILEGELRREEGRLGDLRTEYNKGEPERRGDERNYQKYLDRTAELKSGIARKENDIEALKRELSKTPQ